MLNFVHDFVKLHFKLGFSRSSANLAYYLMFSFFPFLIFLNSVLAIINIDLEEFEQYFELFPSDIDYIVESYISYLDSSDTIVPLFLGILFTLYSFSRFVNSLFYIINDVYEVERPKRSMVSSVFFTFSIMLSVYAILILVVSGNAILSFVGGFIKIPVDLAFLINFGRYLFTILYFSYIILLLYKYIPKVKLTYRDVFPGTLYTIFGTFALSIGFSIYVNYFSNYSVIYGSLSAIMLLMLWLYLTGMIIIQGSLLNKMISDRKKNVM